MHDHHWSRIVGASTNGLGAANGTAFWEDLLPERLTSKAKARVVQPRSVLVFCEAVVSGYFRSRLNSATASTRWRSRLASSIWSGHLREGFLPS